MTSPQFCLLRCKTIPLPSQRTHAPLLLGFSIGMRTLSRRRPLFFGMTIPAESERNLYLTEQQTDIAFLCINDDMPEDDKVYAKTAGIYLEYLEKKWPVPLDCEQ